MRGFLSFQERDRASPINGGGSAAGPQAGSAPLTEFARIDGLLR
jgi:hypothetical protein